LLRYSVGCLPESFASEERVENTAIFNMNLSREENPVQNIRNTQIKITKHFSPVVRL
jgi:hypothetical protein